MTTQLNFDAADVAAASPLALARMVRIDGPDGPESLRLWPHQRELLRLVMTERRVIVLKARQLGVTWALALLALWWAISHPAQTVLIMSIGEREAADVLRRVKRLYGSLPADVRRAFPLGADAMTRLEVQHPDGPGVILSLPSSSTAGRGQTVHLLIGDERPKWPNADDQEAAVLPAAADSGRVVMVGTANGMDGYYDRWMAAPGNGWAPLFVGADARPGRTPEWIATERAQLGDLGAQEFPLTPAEAFLASGRCVFDVVALGELVEHSCRPAAWQGRLGVVDGSIAPEADERGPWQVWQWPQEGRRYLVGADVCGGGGGSDFSAAVVLDAESGDQVAAYHGRPEPHVFARELVRAGWLWRTGERPALLVPESNNHGAAVVALLAEWGFPHVYNQDRFDQRTGKTATSLGWLTTTSTRPVAIAALQAGIREGWLGIRDKQAIAEMFRFVETDTGRFEASAGAHDDRVLAFGITAAVVQHSRQARPAPSVPSAPYVPRVSKVTGY